LIGYCVEGCLFLVYEYIDNGNLSQNLRDLGEINTREISILSNGAAM
jgi:hypothetical protein